MPNLQDAFVEQLKDLYNAEKQLVEALPKMAKAASESKLQKAFEDHLEQTHDQVDRLERVFKEMDMSPSGKKCHAMEGLIEEGEEVIEEHKSGAVRDALLIAAAQRVEHYEIAGYGTVSAWAKELGHSDAADLLNETLDEESKADDKLNSIAKGTVNDAAKAKN